MVDGSHGGKCLHGLQYRMLWAWKAQVISTKQLAHDISTAQPHPTCTAHKVLAPLCVPSPGTCKQEFIMSSDRSGRLNQASKDEELPHVATLHHLAWYRSCQQRKNQEPLDTPVCIYILMYMPTCLKNDVQPRIKFNTAL